jgi:hypothetical protein
MGTRQKTAGGVGLVEVGIAWEVEGEVGFGLSWRMKDSSSGRAKSRFAKSALRSLAMGMFARQLSRRAGLSLVCGSG